MQEIFLGGASREVSIALETRTGRPLPNSQSKEFSHFERNQFAKYAAQYPNVRVRTEPNPIYNCHGFTFASRRTGLHEDDALKHILQDDGYEEIPLDKVLPGDIVIYYGDTGDIRHSGMVIEGPSEPLKFPRIVSKWGKYGEVIHFVHDKPPYYGVTYRYFRITRWD